MWLQKRKPTATYFFSFSFFGQWNGSSWRFRDNGWKFDKHCTHLLNFQLIVEMFRGHCRTNYTLFHSHWQPHSRKIFHYALEKSHVKHWTSLAKKMAWKTFLIKIRFFCWVKSCSQKDKWQKFIGNGHCCTLYLWKKLFVVIFSSAIIRTYAHTHTKAKHCHYNYNVQCLLWLNDVIFYSLYVCDAACAEYSFGWMEREWAKLMNTNQQQQQQKIVRIHFDLYFQSKQYTSCLRECMCRCKVAGVWQIEQKRHWILARARLYE